MSLLAHFNYDQVQKSLNISNSYFVFQMLLHIIINTMLKDSCLKNLLKVISLTDQRNQTT